MSTKNPPDDHLKVVVNGKAVPVKGDPNATLGSLVPEALDKAKVPDKSEPDRWIFKDAAGNVLDKARTIGSFNFAKNQELFLSLEAGVVG